MNDTKQLLCEGPCNPNIKDIDAAMDGEGVLAGLPFERLMLMRRALVYTTHAPTEREHFFVCTACGVARRYGSDKAPARDLTAPLEMADEVR